jgi:hypothetical protein
MRLAEKLDWIGFNSYHVSCFAVTMCQVFSNKRSVKLIGEQLPKMCNVQNNFILIHVLHKRVILSFFFLR